MQRRTLAVALALALTSAAGGATSSNKSLNVNAANPATKGASGSNALLPDSIQMSTYRSGGSLHKVLVDTKHRTASLGSVSANKRIDYDAFSLVETDAAGLHTLTAQGGVMADSLNLVLLNSGVIDTTSTDARTQAAQVPSVTDGKGMSIVQFAGPMRPEWYAELQATGVMIVTAIPSSAYLVYGDESTLQRVSTLRSSSAVQYVAPYVARQRIDAGVADTGGQLTIQLVADASTNAATLALVQSLAQGEVHRQDALHYVNLNFDARPGAAASIAERPDVVSIQNYATPHKMDERQNRIISGFLTGNAPTPGDYLQWLADRGFTQAQFDESGFTVDLTDSGIDNATTTPNHFALRRSGDITQPGRITYNRLVGTPHSGSSLQGVDGHGTLNSHIIGAYIPSGGIFAAAPHADASGFRYDEGVAPFVKVGSSVIFDPDTYTNPNFGTLQSMAYNDGARVSSNSWGASVSGAYNSDSQAYDALVRDAQSGTAGNQEMVIVFSAGNSGPSASTVGSPGTAKNVITVGASEGVQAFGAADQCGIADSGADSANDIISFSSRGPAAGGRKKPDIVGPGTHIGGGVWQSSAFNPATTTNGGAASAFNATGVCAGPGSSDFWPTGGQQWYTASSGTSHSAPAVAGSAALVRQYFINQGLAPPTPAMTKAFLMNSARYMTGVGANDTLWSNVQGMGLLDLGRAFDGVSRIVRDEVGADTLTASGQSRTFTGTVADPSEPLRITLAWTDAPGPTSGSPQLNDLDLTVTVNGSTYLGNVFSGANSASGGSRDSADNVESVFLPAGLPAGSQFAITITAANIVADGVPGSGSSLDQDFALLVYNGQATSSPVIASDGLTLTAENATPPNNAPDPGETVSYDLSLHNVGTGNTTDLVATLQNTGGVTGASAPQDYGVLVASGSSTSQPFTFTVDDGLACGSQITATWTLSDGAADLGSVVQTLTLGVLQSSLDENFDGVTAPALPAGWTTVWSGGGPALWVTSTSSPDTAPNKAVSTDPAASGDASLVSPTFTVEGAGAQISFRHSYNTESSWDGGVLELSIDGGTFQDWLTAGGTFESGGYNGTLGNYTGCSSNPNPLATRPAWTGNSGGYLTTTATFPPSAAGHDVQLRWRMGSDCSVSGTGWSVDGIQVAGEYACSSAPAGLTSDLGITIDDNRAAAQEGQPIAYTIVVDNAGPDAVVGAHVQVPAATGLSALSWTCTSEGTASCPAASGTGPIDALVDIDGNASSKVTFTLNATVQDAPEQDITVMATVAAPAGTTDPNSANNAASDTDYMVLFADGFDGTL